MSITRYGDTSWERQFPVGDRNESHDIEATPLGLQLDYDTLPWGELDEARAAFGDPLPAAAPASAPPDGATKALMHVADCAKSWAKAKSNGRKVEWHERRLERATAALVALGW